MTTCPSCAAAIPAGAAFCPSCGLRLPSASAPLIPSSTPLEAISGFCAPGSLIGERYRIETPIASGAMGMVWRGKDERLHGRPCAIKSVLVGGATPEEKEERTAWFGREIELLSQLRHPAICDIRDVVAERGALFLILELIEGRTLAEELDRYGVPGLLEDKVIGWALTLCDALTYLHSQTPPVIFRDLKPQNIMLRTDGRLALIDFGIARTIVPIGGTAIGTGGYAPPEQYQGLADARSDIYALAATLHHLLTGRDPTRHSPFSFPPVRELEASISEHVEKALMTALHLAPHERFTSAAAFAAALTAAMAPPPQIPVAETAVVPPAVTVNQAAIPMIELGSKEYVLRLLRDETAQLIRARLVHPPIHLAPTEIIIQEAQSTAYCIAMSPADGADEEGATLVLDALTGLVIPDEEALRIRSLALPAPHDDSDATMLPLEELRQRAIRAILTVHGALRTEDGDVATPPASEHSDISPSLTLARLTSARTHFYIGAKPFSASWALAGATATLLTTDLPAAVPICQRCGGVDDRDAACVVCGRYVCSRCMPPLTPGFCSINCHDRQRREQVKQRERDMEQQLHEDLLARVCNPTIRELVSRSGELVTKVTTCAGREIVLTARTGYFQADPADPSGYPVILQRSRFRSVSVTRTGGRWGNSQWEVVVTDPTSHAIAVIDEWGDAQALASVISDWSIS